MMENLYPSIVEISAFEETNQNEWILFDVIEKDAMNRPFRGKVIMHSSSRNLVEQKAIEMRDKLAHGYLSYSGDVVPANQEIIL